MKSKSIQLYIGVAVAAVLWFLMFSPWTAPHISFWLCMALSGVILAAYSTFACREWTGDIRLSWGELLLGAGLAALFWVVFWVGDKLSQLMFDFARPQVDTIYTLQGDTSPLTIALLLLLVIGPAEEIFWRGFVMRRMMERLGKWGGFIVATLTYALVHLWSFNFMLIMAALVIGALWGFVYMKWPRHLGTIIVSHALWDTAAFVLFPF